ncbi:hypothetical protein AVEN_142180-1 [Araneus ventricosus]|uniref:Uncharacterized protein n=1 Tax=Araneus ventricosus TaxID=182803 RepID=A0A4Y2MUK8_ARAVE|nr:hypothetical protein AVEN_142180-1 [Araneus ventricosus]
MGRCPAGRFHFQLGRQTPCKGASNPQWCSDSSQLSWPVLPQLRVPEPPMRTSPKHNTATTSLCMTCYTRGEQLFAWQTAYLDTTIDVMNEKWGFMRPGNSLHSSMVQSRYSRAHCRRN